MHCSSAGYVAEDELIEVTPSKIRCAKCQPFEFFRWHCDAQGEGDTFAEMKLLMYCLQTKEADARQQCAQVAKAQGSLRYWQG